MNVRWLKWRDVLAEAALLRNVDNALNQVEAPEARRIAQAVNVAVDYAWKFHPWECACWVASRASGVSGLILTEPGYAVLRVYEEDPLVRFDAATDREAKVVDFMERSGTLRMNPAVADLTAPAPFYLFRTAAPQFGTASRNTATAYEAGECIYDPATGEAWRCVRAHTNQAVAASWSEWTEGVSYAAAGTLRVRRQGVLVDCTDTHDAIEDLAPGYGYADDAVGEWTGKWSSTPEYWSPQRLPHFLLPAVLAGARVWLEGGGTGAMQEAMLPALETEVSDYTLTRAQRLAPGRSSTIL